MMSLSNKKQDALLAEIRRIQSISKLLDTIESESLVADDNELIDAAWLLHEGEEALRKVATLMRNASKRLQQSIVLKMVQLDKRILRTENVTASFAVDKWVRVPSSRKSDPEKFDKIMQAMGIPKEIAENECVRFHGPGLASYCGGKSNDELPGGLTSNDISNTECYVKFRTTGDTSV